MIQSINVRHLLIVVFVSISLQSEALYVSIFNGNFFFIGVKKSNFT